MKVDLGVQPRRVQPLGVSRPSQASSRPAIRHPPRVVAGPFRPSPQTTACQPLPLRRNAASHPKRRGRHDVLRVAAASASAGGTGPGSTASKPAAPSGLKKFLLDQFVPIGLCVAIAVGCLFPGPGAWAAQYGVLQAATTGIFIISGLNLRRGEALQALAAWPSVLFGAASILLLTPLAGVAALALPLAPRELALGLAVFCCMPTTLSTGVTLATQCNANAALALLLTVGTNLAGVFTLPLVLPAVLGSGAGGVTLSPAALLASLIRTVLLPLLAGAAARAFVPGVAQLVDGNRRALQIASGALLCSTPWTQVSTAVSRGISLQPPALLAVAAAALVLHGAMLAFNISAANLLRLGGTGADAPKIRRAVVLCASQKTLPVAVATLTQLGSTLGGAVGLAVIPCVMSHMLQILVDSMIVSGWVRADAAAAAAAERGGQGGANGAVPAPAA